MQGDESQNKFAHKIDISQSYLRMLESERKNITVEMMDKIVDNLGYDLEIRLRKKDSANGN